MNHLTSTQIQAVADAADVTDNVAPQADRDHAASCAACAARVAERKQQGAAFAGLMNGVDLPAATARRVDGALAGARSAGGATRLRRAVPGPRWHRAAWGTAGMIAATLLAIVFVAPLIKQDRGTVSAAEILARSANRLAALATGVELLEYELVLDGVPKDMMPDHANGTYQVRQAIDHTVPGRFRFSTYGPGGQPVSSIAQDPASGRRVMLVNLEGQAYRFNVSVPSTVGASLPEMERLHMEASIAMMQASGNQLLEVVESPDGRRYRIEVPAVSATATNPVWDLTEARVLIDAKDYRVTELAVKGTFLKQAYSVSYRLINRVVAASVPPDTFEVPRLPGEIVISGGGSALPARDAMILALRELARLKQAHE
ncbi:MAG: hypothetical protein H0W08_20115 [Acidobacteria bacterium]|nr:hypothetical protein [Acidobacteriota bacterium]